MKNKKKANGPEREAVYTTIVGGRPPGSGTDVGAIPRGIEVLVKKASVDPEFRSVLLEKRAEAAEEIELELTDSEAAMLASIPRAQLEAIIAKTKVGPESRRLFLGKAAGIMLAALGVSAAGCKPRTKGIEPDRPESNDGSSTDQQAPQPVISAGIVSDHPQDSNQITRGVRPDKPSVTKGIQPDRPVE
jgi:hypothetical protein